MGRTSLGEIVKHIITTTVFLAGVGALAYGFELWSGFLTSRGASAFSIQVTDIAGHFLYVVDVIGVIGGATIFTIKLLRSAWKD